MSREGAADISGLSLRWHGVYNRAAATSCVLVLETITGTKFIEVLLRSNAARFICVTNHVGCMARHGVRGTWNPRGDLYRHLNIYANTMLPDYHAKLTSYSVPDPVHDHDHVRVLNIRIICERNPFRVA